MHYTRQAIVDALAGHTSLTIELGAGDVAWRPGMVDVVGPLTTVTGPGVATYRRRHQSPVWMAGFDAPEGDRESDAYRAAVAELRAQAEVNLP